MLPDLSRVYPGWYIAAAGATTNIVVMGFILVGFGIFIRPMREELGWSVAAIAAGYSVRSFEQGFLSPVAGYLVDRLGPRRMAISGLAILAAGLLLFSQVHTLPLYYVASATIALGQSLGTSTPYSVALIHWFIRKRGRAMGVLNTGGGFAYFTTPLLAVLLVVLGWRNTLALAAVLVLAVGVPLTLTLKGHPAEHGYEPDGRRIPPRPPADGDQLPVATGPATRNEPSGASVAEALRTPAFYLLVLATAAAGGTYQGWIVHLIPHLENVGYTTATAGLMVAGFGGFQVVLRFSAGWLGDRVGRRKLYMACFPLIGIGMLIFANLSPSRPWLLPLYYLTHPVGHAISVALGQIQVADYFGARRFGTLRGLNASLHMPVGVALPILAGVMFDRTGDYGLAFSLFGMLALSGLLWIWLIRRGPWPE